MKSRTYSKYLYAYTYGYASHACMPSAVPCAPYSSIGQELRPGAPLDPPRPYNFATFSPFPSRSTPMIAADEGNLARGKRMRPRHFRPAEQYRLQKPPRRRISRRTRVVSLQKKKKNSREPGEIRRQKWTEGEEFSIRSLRSNERTEDSMPSLAALIIY